MLKVTKARNQLSEKLSEFRQLQLTFGVFFILKALERQKCGAWNMRTLNTYVLAHDYCGLGLKDKTVSAKAILALQVLEAISKKYYDHPIATDLQMKALWLWHTQLVDDVKHIPKDMFGTALHAAKTTEEIQIKSGKYATRETLLESDIKLGLAT